MANKRFVFPFPNSEKFFDRVHDRLHAVVERYVYQSRPGSRFTLIVNAIPRDKSEEIDMTKEVPLEYVSIPKQRDILASKNKIQALDSCWNGLDRKELDSITADEGSDSWKKVIEKTYSFSDIWKGSDHKNTLEEYFDEKLKPLNESQKLEKPILEHYFVIKSDGNKKSDCYISIPLIQFGEIDGFVYIVYQDKDHELFQEDKVKNIITGFSIEYEGVVLAWDLAQERYDRSYAFRKLIDLICADDNKDYFEKKNPIPIFFELNYPEYYRNHRAYFESRFVQHDEMLTELYRQLIRFGATTILLDSYAHNISAHALTTLTWIFKKRSRLKLKAEQLKLIERNTTVLISQALRNQYKPDEEDVSSTYSALIEYGGSLTREIFPFLKFLQEKGAFWSGLTRDVNAGGQVNSLYSILWYDFIYNALYLGTIAESESIRKLHIDITIYEETAKDVLQDKEFVTKMPKGKTYRFATVNLEHMEEHRFDANRKDSDNKEGDNEKGDWYVALPDGTPVWYSDHPGLENLSRFVQLGQDFPLLKEELKNVKIFFPGSVVGKHAFFTMIENELRNIKHYFGKEAEKAKKGDGLSLNISLQPVSLRDNTSVELYRIGLWLGLESKLSDPLRADGNPNLVKRRFDMLWKDILDEETRQPRLGGNSQDKVCAAMLFNSSFSSVQRGSFRTQALEGSVRKGALVGNEKDRARRDAIFYPWVTPAVCFANIDTEFRVPAGAADFDVEYDAEKGEVIYQRQEKAFEKSIDVEYEKYEREYGKKDKKGFLKKYLFVWKGESIRTESNDAVELRMDHLGRFKFVMAEQDSETWKQARDNGVIRLVGGLSLAQDAHERTRLSEAYKQWLKLWISEDQMALRITDKKAGNRGTLVFDKNQEECLLYYTTLPTPKDDPKDSKIYRKPTDNDLKDFGILLDRNRDQFVLDCAHKTSGLEPNYIQYRSHGIIAQYFVPTDRGKTGLLINQIPSEKLMELFEMMATKICLVDNRLFNRVDENRFAFYQDKLKLSFHKEDTPEKDENGKWISDWEDNATKAAISNSHFLVIHLSFIDRLIQEKYSNEKAYEEGNLGLFIEKEIEPLVGKSQSGEGLRDNFILTVTTGRGRQNWQEFLAGDKYKHYHKYKKSVIFRPIESLISAIEDSLMIKDDFDLKYRLIKVLFGS